MNRLVAFLRTFATAVISVRVTAVSFLVHPSSLGRRSFSILLKPHQLEVTFDDRMG